MNTRRPSLAITLLTIAVSSLIFSTAVAQDCAQILRCGIFDVSRTSKQSELAQSYLQWLSNQSFATQTQAQQASGALGVTLPIDGIPVTSEASGGSTGSSSSSWSSAVAQAVASDSNARNLFAQEFIKANSSIVAAWQNCATQQKGLISWAEQTPNADEILLKVELRPPSGNSKNKALITDIVHSSFLTAKSPYKDVQISIAPRAFLFTRSVANKRKAANFVVSTNDVDYQSSCNVDAVPEPPPPPSLPQTFFFKDGLGKEWTDQHSYQLPGAKTANGPYSNKEIGVVLSNAVVPHSWVAVSFDLYVMGEWKGEDWRLVIREGDADPGRTIYQNAFKSPQVLRVSTTGAHNTNRLMLNFRDAGGGNLKGTWAVRNVRITVEE